MKMEEANPRANLSSKENILLSLKFPNLIVPNEINMNQKPKIIPSNIKLDFLTDRIENK